MVCLIVAKDHVLQRVVKIIHAQDQHIIEYWATDIIVYLNK